MRIVKRWSPAGEVFEDVGPKPVRIKSWDHLKRICEEKGLVSVAVENRTMSAIHRSSTRQRFVMRGGKLVQIEKARKENAHARARRRAKA